MKAATDGASTTVNRTAYGEIQRPIGTSEDVVMYDTAADMIRTATARKKLPRAYDSIKWDQKRRADGDAVHHEIYDYTTDGKAVLMCVRCTEGTKYGVRTTSKTYYIVSVYGSGLRVVETSKAKAAKAAKAAGNTLGEAIDVCRGEKTLAIKTAVVLDGYKIVSEPEPGQYASVFDGSTWDIDVTRIEASTDDHTGGYYVYGSLENAVGAWESRKTFADEWMTGSNYAVLRCECSGRSTQFGSGKICVTRVRPVEKVVVLGGIEKN